MKYQYWLSNIPGVGCKTIHRLLGQAGSAEEIYFLKKEQLEKLSGLSDRQVHAITDRKKNWDLEEKYAALGENGISFLSCEMESYPKQLRNIVDAPYSLYIKGKMPDFSKRRVAVVGARMCSEYGKKMAEQIGEKLALCGAEVLSGMARGIDGTAQRAAIKGGGKSYAVLGCGPDICYPMQNRDLYQNLLKNGGVLSEYPPGSSPLPFHFPMRNRIISGLSDLVIVIEAREKSGSLITADQALEQGRDVMVLPGRAGDALSAGCNRLIDQGAGIFLSTDQILERLEIKKKNHTNTKKTYIALESEENLVYSVLEFQAKNLQSIADETNLTPQKVSAILVRLMLCGLVAEDVKNHYSKV